MDVARSGGSAARAAPVADGGCAQRARARRRARPGRARRARLPPRPRLGGRRLPRRRGVLHPQRLPHHPAPAGRADPHGARRRLGVHEGAGAAAAARARHVRDRHPGPVRLARAHGGAAGDGLASLLYVQNWHLVLAGLPYSEAFARPSPLLHLWSLSVEGQLYLLWPLLLVGVLAMVRRSTALLVTILLAFASAVLMALRFDPDGGSLAYYATDTRASGFLVGAALAWVWRPPAWSRPLPRAARWGIDAAGIVAVVTLVVGFVAVSEFDAGLYLRGGFLWVGMLAAVLIVAATRSRGVLAALLSRPLVVAVGRRSYGLYLYHWPVFVLGRELPLPPWTINAVGCARDRGRRGGVLPVDRDPRAARRVGSADGQAAAAPACGRRRVRRGDGGRARHRRRADRPRQRRRRRPGPGVVANSAGAAADLSRGGQEDAPDSSIARRRAVRRGRAYCRAGGGAASRPRPAQAVARPVQAVERGRRVVRWCRARAGAPAGSTGRADPRARRATAARPPGGPRTRGPALVVGDSIALGSADSLRRALGAGTHRRRQGRSPVLGGAGHRRGVGGGQRRTHRHRPRGERHRRRGRRQGRHRRGGRPARGPRRRARAPPLAGWQQRRSARRRRRPSDRRVRRLGRARRRQPRCARARRRAPGVAGRALLANAVAAAARHP